MIEPRLFPPASWFREIASCPVVIRPLDSRWNKREKNTHRYAIADVNGRIELTVPVMKPESLSRCTLSDIRLSTHGNWWHVHRVTLESGYGRTPFFEHYFPKLEIFFSAEVVETYPFLWQYLLATTQTVADILQMETRFAAGMARNSVNLQNGCEIKTQRPEESYWQVRHDKLGFIDGLSILDLIFNIGPEACFHISQR